MARWFLLLSLGLLLGCPPGDDDSSDDDDTPPRMECAEPADPPPPVTDCGFHEALPDDWNWISFGSEDGAIEILIVREWLMQGAGFTSIYALRGFGAVIDGCVVCVQDETALAYFSTHHNWDDQAWLRLPEQELELHMPYEAIGGDPQAGYDWYFQLSGLSPDDREVVLWGPVALEGLDGMVPGG